MLQRLRSLTAGGGTHTVWQQAVVAPVHKHRRSKLGMVALRECHEVDTDNESRGDKGNRTKRMA